MLYEYQPGQFKPIGVFNKTKTENDYNPDYWNVPTEDKQASVRGVTCYGANLGIGNFNDNTEHMEKAAKYLEKWPYILRRIPEKIMQVSVYQPVDCFFFCIFQNLTLMIVFIS